MVVKAGRILNTDAAILEYYAELCWLEFKPEWAIWTNLCWKVYICQLDIVKFMDVLLSSSRAATEKKKILEEEFGVAMNEELEREVLVMCNLSQGVKAEGREEGINIGEMRMLVKQVRKGRVTIEEAAEDAGMTVEEFKKVMENTPLQAV